MKTRYLAPVAALSAVFSVVCWAAWTATITESFDGTIDDTFWRIPFDDEIVTDGGNPGGFLRATGLTTAIPVVENWELPSPTNPFLGRYRIDGVSELAVDLSVFGASQGVDDRPVSLGLIAGGCELVLSEQEVPRPGVGWKTYRFNVPSWKQAMPQKWVARGTCAGMPRDDAWNFVMGGQYINAVHFYLGDPAGLYPVQTWTIGVDNVRVTNGKFGTPS